MDMLIFIPFLCHAMTPQLFHLHLNLLRPLCCPLVAPKGAKVNTLKIWHEMTQGQLLCGARPHVHCVNWLVVICVPLCKKFWPFIILVLNLCLIKLACKNNLATMLVCEDCICWNHESCRLQKIKGSFSTFLLLCTAVAELNKVGVC